MTAGHIKTQLGGVPEYLRMKPVNVNIDVSDRRWRQFVDGNSSDMILMTAILMTEILKLQRIPPIFNWPISLKSLICCDFGVILMTKSGWRFFDFWLSTKIDVGDNILQNLSPTCQCQPNILSRTYFVSNIRHRNRCRRWFFVMQQAYCGGNREIRLDVFFRSIPYSVEL